MPNRQMICPRCWGSRTEPGVDSITDAACSRCGGKGTEDDQPLSSNFMLSEALFSQHAMRGGIPNDPPAEIIPRLQQVALECAEKIRAVHGKLKVDSGYRSAAVNGLLPGASGTSAHMLGWALDLVPLTPGKTLKEVMDWIVASDIEFDQVIFEYGWIHIARFGPGGCCRRQVLQKFSGSPYQPYEANDPRVLAL